MGLGNVLGNGSAFEAGSPCGSDKEPRPSLINQNFSKVNGISENRASIGVVGPCPLICWSHELVHIRTLRSPVHPPWRGFFKCE
jgi:hypothetical protein